MSSPDVKNPPSQAPPAEQKHEILPTLFGDGYGLYEVRKGSFVVSFLLNSAILALLIWVTSWTASHAPQIKKVVGLSVDISPYVLPPSKDISGGGGGGGSHDINPASKGALPKFAKTQIAPPTVLPMEQPKLPVTPTVVVPPEIKLPQVGPMGDPMAKVIGPLSNGTGPAVESAAAAAAEWDRDAVPASVPAWGGGIGGGAYHVGGGVLRAQDLSAGSSLSSAKRPARTSGRETCSFA